jgi:photosystem II stability/assembly factor-like uncharacterized protein
MNRKAILSTCLIIAASLACKTMQNVNPPTSPATDQAPTGTSGPAETPTITLTPTPVVPPAEIAAMSWEPLAAGTEFAPVVVNTLAIDPTDPNVIFAGTYGAGIYISRDGGETWEVSNAGIGKGTVGTIAIDSVNPDTVYAALFDQGGLYKSIDGGKTWEAINRGIDLSQGWNWTAFVNLDPSDNQNIFFSGSQVLYFSHDAGASFSMITNNCPFITGLAVDPADGRHLLAASFGQPGICAAGIYRSTNGGQDWNRVTSTDMAREGDQYGGDWWHMAVDPRDFDTIYAGGQNKTYRSTDGGETWTQVRNGGCRWLSALWDGRVFCATGQGSSVYSTNGGQSWAPSNLGSGRGDGMEGSALAQAPGTQTLYAGADAVYRSSNGGASWERLAPLAAARLGITVDPRDGNRIFLTGVDNSSADYRSTDRGHTWTTLSSWVGSYYARLTFDPSRNVIYRPGLKQWDTIHRSLDGGDTWNRFGSGYMTYNPLKILADPNNPGTLWMVGECSSHLAVSHDDGLSFEAAPGFNWNICQPAFAMDTSGQRLYVLAYDVIRSTDGGTTWHRVAALDGTFRSIAVDPTNADIVYAGSTYRGIFKTIDGGLSWSKANRNMPGSSVNEIAIDPGEPQTVYIATDSGLFITLNGGDWWWPITQGLGPSPIVYSVAVDPSDPQNVYATTPDGVYRLVR